MKQDNILIEVIVTNQCNKRCEYCDLDFRNDSLSRSDFDALELFLKSNPADYTINFFWGEPLLGFESIKYILPKIRPYVSRVLIGTNGVLFTEEILNFLEYYDVQILLTIDNIEAWNDVDLDLAQRYAKNIKVNFVNDPDFLFRSIEVYDRILSLDFHTVAFMPIFATKSWSNKALMQLKEVYRYVSNHTEGITLETYTYYNGTTADMQFVLDTDAYFYADFDWHLWLQKQYGTTNKALSERIHKESKLFSLHDSVATLQRLKESYDLKTVLDFFFRVPAESGDLLSYKVIDKILYNGLRNRK